MTALTRRLLVAGGDTSGEIVGMAGVTAIEIVGSIDVAGLLCRTFGEGSVLDGTEGRPQGRSGRRRRLLLRSCRTVEAPMTALLEELAAAVSTVITDAAGDGRLPAGSVPVDRGRCACGGGPGQLRRGGRGNPAHRQDRPHFRWSPAAQARTGRGGQCDRRVHRAGAGPP